MKPAFRNYFETFAKEKNFDPLVAKNWYSINKDDLQNARVRSLQFYPYLSNCFCRWSRTWGSTITASTMPYWMLSLSWRGRSCKELVRPLLINSIRYWLLQGNTEQTWVKFRTFLPALQLFTSLTPCSPPTGTRSPSAKWRRSRYGILIPIYRDHVLKLAGGALGAAALQEHLQGIADELPQYWLRGLQSTQQYVFQSTVTVYHCINMNIAVSARLRNLKSYKKHPSLPLPAVMPDWHHSFISRLGMPP